MPSHDEHNLNIPSPASGPLPRRLNLVLVLVAAGLAIVLWFGTNALIRRSDASRLPVLPDLTLVPTPVAMQLRNANDLARKHPTNAAYLGALARAYHANTFSRRAESCYRLAAMHDPDHWHWPYALILLAAELGDNESALIMLRKFVRRNDDHALAWLRLGEAEFNVENDAEARRAYERAEELARQPDSRRRQRDSFFPMTAYARFGQARIAFRQGHDEDVAARLEPVTESSPRFGPAHRLLGRAYQRLGREEEASRQLDQALQCGPYTPPVDPFIDELTMQSRSMSFLLKEAGVAFNKADVEWSERVLRRAIELYPADEDVVGELTLLLCRLKRYEEAMPFLERFLALPPTHFATPSKIAAELLNLQYIDRAIECYQLAMDLQPGHPPNHLNLGMALAMAGRFQEAEPCFQRTLRLEPHNYLARRNLARLMLDTQRYESAIVEFEKALQVKPEDVDGRYRLGQAHQALGQSDEAINAYSLALEMNPDHPSSLDAIATLCAQRSQFDEAYRYARRLVAVAGRFPQAHVTLARIAFSAEDFDLAREHCRLALEIEPNFEPARQVLSQLPQE